MEKPDSLQDADLDDRLFPMAWKESYFRLHFDHTKGGYVCPDCQKVYSAMQFNLLDGDHIIPYSKGGKTTWENFTLRCKKCNLQKSDK